MQKKHSSDSSIFLARHRRDFLIQENKTKFFLVGRTDFAVSVFGKFHTVVKQSDRIVNPQQSLQIQHEALGVATKGLQHFIS